MPSAKEKGSIPVIFAKMNLKIEAIYLLKKLANLGLNIAKTYINPHTADMIYATMAIFDIFSYLGGIGAKSAFSSSVSAKYSLELITSRTDSCISSLTSSIGMDGCFLFFIDIPFKGCVINQGKNHIRLKFLLSSYWF